MAKRLVDMVLVIVSLPITLPIGCVTALLVAVWLGLPVLFSQVRIGLNGRPFTMYKFRSMRETRNSAGELLSDEQRLSFFGRFLRASSLDELPELWNVLRGDMSLVGPRPLLPEYLPLYSERQRRRHHVRPGITGWAQINGRNGISWEEKFEHDVWYVEHHSLCGDLMILLKTVLHVLRPRGISAAGDATMPRFTGSVPTKTGDGL